MPARRTPRLPAGTALVRPTIDFVSLRRATRGRRSVRSAHPGGRLNATTCKFNAEKAASARPGERRPAALVASGGGEDRQPELGFLSRPAAAMGLARSLRLGVVGKPGSRRDRGIGRLRRRERQSRAVDPADPRRGRQARRGAAAGLDLPAHRVVAAGSGAVRIWS